MSSYACRYTVTKNALKFLQRFYHLLLVQLLLILLVYIALLLISDCIVFPWFVLPLLTRILLKSNIILQ